MGQYAVVLPICERGLVAKGRADAGVAQFAPRLFHSRRMPSISIRTGGLRRMVGRTIPSTEVN